MQTTQDKINRFFQNETIAEVLRWAAFLSFAVFTAFLIAKKGIAIAAVLMALPIVVAYFILFFRYPKLGIYTSLVISFVLPMINRWGDYYGIPLPPLGLGVDILLLLTYVIVILKYWRRTDFSALSNDVMLLLTLWMAYIVLQIANPLAYSFAAWFYSMRGIALYQLLIIGLGFWMFNSRKDFYNWLHLFLGFSALAIVWAIKQKFIGVSPAEQKWLDDGEHVTHVLFGKLRIFSYYFDAGTFGAAMGHVCIVSAVLFLGPYSRARKIFYFLMALFGFYAMMLSGTRGALAVPGLGGVAFLVMSKNVRLLVLGSLIMLGGFVFLKYTTILQSNYEVNRLRTALDSDDPSLNTRKRNRKRLTEYLRDKPFGGGVGTTGSWGKRFSPGTWLADFEPDGLYTRIRAETGLIGRQFYVWMWLYILFKAIWKIWKMPAGTEEHNVSMALMSGYAGILLANYGNAVMTQHPISLVTFLSISTVYTIHRWNNPTKPYKDREW